MLLWEEQAGHAVPLQLWVWAGRENNTEFKEVFFQVKLKKQSIYTKCVNLSVSVNK